MKSFTLVSTVFNEISRLENTISDMENQTVKPTEIVITDAGSTDGTFERLLKWKEESSIKINILKKVKCNVAEGRNLAIENASYDLIVSTDFGCRFNPKWLESLILPFNNPEVEVVGGSFSVQEEDITSIAAKATYVLCNGYKVDINEDFIPSSRSIAYYKKVWRDANKYPEWLTLAADDLVFGKVVKKKGYKIFLVKEPYVYWGRHSKTAQYSKEAFRYGLGDGEAKVNEKNYFARIVETAARYFFIAGLLLLFLLVILNKITLPFFLVLAPFFVVGFRPYYWAMKNWLRLKSDKYNVKVLLYSFYLIELSRIWYIRGYSKGYFNGSIRQKEEAKKLKAILS